MQGEDIRRESSAVSELLISDSDDSCDNVGKSKRDSSPEVDEKIIFIPNNPKTWTEKHIETWIKWASKKFRLTTPLDVSRFPKSAEELAAFSKADFYIVCGSFEGGKMISQHYKYMMQNSNQTFDETLLSDCDPGERCYYQGASLLVCQFLKVITNNKFRHESYDLGFPEDRLVFTKSFKLV